MSLNNESNINTNEHHTHKIIFIIWRQLLHYYEDNIDVNEH